MKKAFIDSELHTTRGNKSHIKRGLTGIPCSGEGFSKRANAKYKYTNYNKEGTTNRLEWLI